VRGLQPIVPAVPILTHSTTIFYSLLPILVARHALHSILKKKISSASNVVQGLEIGIQSLRLPHVRLVAMLHAPLVSVIPTPNVSPALPPTFCSPTLLNAPPPVLSAMKPAPVLTYVCLPNTATLHAQHALLKPTWPNAEPVPIHSLPLSHLPQFPPTPMLYVCLS
jgi:hypothetical protein